MNYWIHRCAYEGGHEILEKEHRLTIGFSACANNQKLVDAVQKKNSSDFDSAYKTVYDGEVWRGRWSLWYFTCEMSAGDIVVVPRNGGFNICELKGSPIVSDRKDEVDIGWEWDVDVIACCFPRDAYASAALLSRMKCRQTTLNINDLKDGINEALRRHKENKPFSLPNEMALKCREILANNGLPEFFEKVLFRYFERLGANAEILPKNISGKVGDCDVSAVFPALRTTVSVQAKRHTGTTSDWAVRQITEYAQSKEESREENWSYVNWVVSLADDFSEDAKRVAKEHNVVLINGQEFCRMLVSMGIGDFS